MFYIFLTYIYELIVSVYNLYHLLFHKHSENNFCNFLD